MSTDAERLTQIAALHGPGKRVHDVQSGPSVACRHCHKTWPCVTRILAARLEEASA